MKVLTSLILASSLATTPGPIARAVSREAAQLAGGGQTSSESARAWTRVTTLAPGTEIILTTRGTMSAARVFVVADESGLTALNLSGPSLPAEVTKTLRKMASESPERFAAISRGAGFTDGKVHLGLDGVMVGGQRIAAIDDVLDRPSRADVLEIRTAKPRSTGALGAAGAVVGAVGGLFLGGLVGAAVENNVHPCRCDDPGLMGALVGMPVGAIGGGVLGYYAARQVAPDVIYHAP
jgi:hypothetical protein